METVKGTLFLLVAACVLTASRCEDIELEPDNTDTGQGNNGPTDPADTDVDSDTDTDTDVDGDTDGAGGTDTDVDGDTDTDVDGDTDTTNCSTDPADVCCSVIQYKVEKKPINVLILLDRSASMSESQVAGRSLEAITDEALSELTADPRHQLVNFGLAVFPSEACPSISTAAEEQCYPTEEWLVKMGENRAETIAQSLEGMTTCGGTPMCDSLAWAHEQLGNLDDDLKENSTYILLVTDGVPNCNLDLDPTNCVNTNPDGDLLHSAQCLDDACVADVAAALLADGIQTLVVGVGNEIELWKDAMRTIAQAVSGGDLGYVHVNEPEALVAGVSPILGTLIAEPVPCTYEIDWEAVPGKLGEVRACDKVAVEETSSTAAGGGLTIIREVPFSPGCVDPTGWHWSGDPEVDLTSPLDMCSVMELCEGFCDRVKFDSVDTISLKFGSDQCRQNL